MPQHRFTALYRSVSNPFRKAVIPSRVWGQSHFGSHPILKPPSKALKCQFSSAIPRNASARFAQRPPQTPQPPPPETEPEPEYYTPPPVPPKKTKEPGSGLAKLFLAITIPVLFLTSLDNIARKGVSPDEVRQALGLNPNTRPSPVAYDYYIYNNRPDLVPYIQAGVKMKENFSFRPLNFSGNNLDDPFRWWTLVTPQFNHGGPLHLFINYTAFMALAPPVVQLYGPGVTVICFLVGGIIATTIVGFYEKATNPFMKMSPAEIKLKVEAAGPTKEDKRLYRQATSWHMGASTSLMALGTISAIVYPAMRLNLMFIPIGIPIRTAIGAVAAFDVGGMIWDYGLSIGHSGHLGGAIAGLLLYQFWVRKLPTIMQRRIQQLMREKGIKI